MYAAEEQREEDGSGLQKCKSDLDRGWLKVPDSSLFPSHNRILFPKPRGVISTSRPVSAVRILLEIS